MRSGRRTTDLGRAAVLAAALVVLALISPGTAGAATDACGFTGVAGAHWDVGTNWSCGHVPDADDDVTLALGDSPLVTAADALAGTLTVDTGSTLGFANAPELDVTGTATF